MHEALDVFRSIAGDGTDREKMASATSTSIALAVSCIADDAKLGAAVRAIMAERAALIRAVLASGW